MRLSKRIVTLVALLATSLATAVSYPVRAADEEAVDYETGKALICDTRAQAERFVALFNGDAPAAVGVVNAEQHDPTACAIANVAYVRGPSLGYLAPQFVQIGLHRCGGLKYLEDRRQARLNRTQRGGIDFQLGRRIRRGVDGAHIIALFGRHCPVLARDRGLHQEAE